MDFIPDLFEQDYLFPDYVNPNYKTSKRVKKKNKYKNYKK